MAWRVGVAETDITPRTPQWMSGMGYRTEKSKGVYLPLRAFALYLSDGAADVILLNADLIDFPRSVIAAVRRELRARFGLADAGVVFCATHSHDTPRISDDIVVPGCVDPVYRDGLVSALAAVGAASRQRAQPLARVEFSRTRESVGVNRRQLRCAEGVVVHAPNPEGVRDRVADTRWFYGRNGRLVASMTSFGCHATACGQYELGGDFPGFFRQAVSADTGAPALWCAGCGANVRPWFTGSLDSYGGGTVAAARQMGKVHAAHVLAGKANAVRVALSGLRVVSKVVRLGLQAPLSYRRFRAQGFGDYARTLGETVVRAAWLEAHRKRTVPFETQVLSLGPEHHLVFWSGEVCAEVGIGLKDLCPGWIVTPHGYANGCVGYIPAEHMFMLKGYEVDRSCYLYKLPAPFRPDVERRILRTSLALIGAAAAIDR